MQRNRKPSPRDSNTKASAAEPHYVRLVPNFYPLVFEKIVIDESEQAGIISIWTKSADRDEPLIRGRTKSKNDPENVRGNSPGNQDSFDTAFFAQDLIDFEPLVPVLSSVPRS